MYTLYKFHFLNGISEINQLFDDILIIWPAPVCVCIYIYIYMSFNLLQNLSLVFFDTWKSSLFQTLCFLFRVVSAGKQASLRRPLVVRKPRQPSRALSRPTRSTAGCPLPYPTADVSIFDGDPDMAFFSWVFFFFIIKLNYKKKNKLAHHILHINVAHSPSRRPSLFFIEVPWTEHLLRHHNYSWVGVTAATYSYGLWIRLRLQAKLNVHHLHSVSLSVLPLFFPPSIPLSFYSWQCIALNSIRLAPIYMQMTLLTLNR